jgi:hypothetical protein
MDTEARLEKLERELCVEKRRTRWLLAVVGLGFVGVLAWTLATITSTAQAEGANTGPKVIRATQFILEGENGKVRAMLLVDKDGSGLFLNDENAKRRVVLSGDKDGPRLDLNGENENLRATLSVVKDVSSGLYLQDKTGRPSAALVVSKWGPGLILHDENGKRIFSQP